MFKCRKTSCAQHFKTIIHFYIKVIRYVEGDTFVGYKVHIAVLLCKYIKLIMKLSAIYFNRLAMSFIMYTRNVEHLLS